MASKSDAALGGGIVLIVIVALQWAEKWTVVSSLLDGLRQSGPFGQFIVNGILSPIVLLALGVAAVLLGLQGRRRRAKPNREVIESPSSVSSASVGAGAFMKTGDVIQNFHLGEQQKPPPPSLPKSERPKPTIKFIRAEIVDVHFGGRNEQERVITTNSDQTSRKALIARFRNDVSTYGKPGANTHARANLILRDQDGNEIGHGISAALWLDDPHGYDHYEMETGSGGCAVLLIKTGNGCVIPWKRSQDTNYGRIFLTEVEALDKPPKTIEVRLLGGAPSGLLLNPEVVDVAKLLP